RIEIRDKGCIRLRDLKEVLGRSKARRFYGSGDVEHRVALGNDYRVQVDVAAAKARLNVDDGGPFIKKGFPGFKGSSTMNVAPQNKCFLAANDSGVLQFQGNASSGKTGAEHDECLAGGFHRRQKGP